MELTGEGIFRDDGYSGATLNRPGLDRLRDAARAGEVTQVLVTDPDRLARNYVKLMVLLEELERAGCEVTFLDRPLGRDPQDQLLLQIRGAVAEYERALDNDELSIDLRDVIERQYASVKAAHDDVRALRDSN